MRNVPLMVVCALLSAGVFSQELKPGFDGQEYLDMLSINFQRFDSAIPIPSTPAPANYHVVYRSPELGMMNRWNCWYRNDNKVAVISLRGTVGALPSWLENYWGAMVPARGELQINDTTVFRYTLSEDGKAHVHVGWLTGLAHLAPTIVEQIKKAYAEGIRSFIIMGHSQGGALAALTRSYLYYLAKSGGLPSDIQFKTYCSAAPKAGNLFYAYDFDFIARGGWGFTVVNAADWVPETLFSIQTTDDFNPQNPFIHLDNVLKTQSFLARWVIRHKYNRMRNSVRTAQKRFEKNLGGLVFNYVHKVLPQMREPSYVHDNNFQRAGVPIVLQPDSAYYAKFPATGPNLFEHHLFAAYAWLASQYYPE